MSRGSILEAIGLMRDCDEAERHVGIPASDAAIENAEGSLGVIFPDDLKAFLAEFGHGGIGGVNIMGLFMPDTPTMAEHLVIANEEARLEGLPNSVLLTEDVGDGSFFAIDVSEGSQFGRVVVWPLGGDDPGNLEEISCNFGDFLLIRVRDELEVIERHRTGP